MSNKLKEETTLEDVAKFIIASLKYEAQFTNRAFTKYHDKRINNYHHGQVNAYLTVLVHMGYKIDWVTKVSNDFELTRIDEIKVDGMVIWESLQSERD